MHYRYYLLNTHYRKKLNFSYEGLDTAKNAYESLASKIIQLKKESDGKLTQPDKGYIEKFIKVINDDLNVTEGLAVLWELTKDKNLSPAEKLSTIYDLDKVLGLELDSLEETGTVDIPGEVITLADNRLKAKQDKDFALADKLRDQIKELGYEVMDTKDGYELKKI